MYWTWLISILLLLLLSASSFSSYFVREILASDVWRPWRLPQSPAMVPNSGKQIDASYEFMKNCGMQIVIVDSMCGFAHNGLVTEMYVENYTSSYDAFMYFFFVFFSSSYTLNMYYCGCIEFGWVKADITHYRRAVNLYAPRHCRRRRSNTNRKPSEKKKIK